MSVVNPAVAAKEAAILADLEAMTYAQVSDKHGVSRGKVWQIATHHGRRKNEARIQERKRDRKRRQHEFLQEIMDASQTCDVLDFLDGLPDGCVDLHATSIPYNVGKAYGGSQGIDRRRYHYYVGWLLQVLSEMTRTLRDGGVMFVNMGSTKDDADQLRPLDTVLLEYLLAMGLLFQNRVIWTIPHGLTPKGRLSARHEVALVLSKGTPRHFHANAARAPQKQPDKRAYKSARRGELSGHPLGAWPSDVWQDIGNVGHNHPEKSAGEGHPAQFPRALVEKAIRLYTASGDLVCDPFDGSGTTTSTAIAEGRSAIGCDLFYGETRARRLAGVTATEYCTLPGVTERSIAVWQAEARPRAHAAADAGRATRDLLDEVAPEPLTA